MKYKAKYGAESDIPADVKAFYVMKDGEWVFDGGEFDGLDALLNPGLAANRDAFKAEKDTEKTARKQAETDRDKFKADLDKVSKPGTVVLDAAEQQLLSEYKALGPIKDVKEKLDNEKVVSEKLAIVSTESEVRAFAKQAGLNEDVLVDFRNSERGKDVIFALETKKVKDDKGKETEKPVLVVKITDDVNGEKKTSTKDFTEFAKEKAYPEYLVTAILNGPAASEETSTKKGFVAPPSLSQKTNSTNDTKVDVNKVVSKFNEERSTRKMPWSTPQEKTETT